MFSPGDKVFCHSPYAHLRTQTYVVDRMETGRTGTPFVYLKGEGGGGHSCNRFSLLVSNKKKETKVTDEERAAKIRELVKALNEEVAEAEKSKLIVTLDRAYASNQIRVTEVKKYF